MYQTGNYFERTYTYDEPVSIVSGGSSATFAAIALTNLAPALDNMKILISAQFTPNAANDVCYFRAGGSSATTGHVITGDVAAKYATRDVSLVSKLVTAVPTVEYKVTASGALTATLVSFVDVL